MLEQRRGDAQRAGRRVGEAESTRVGEESHVERLRDLGRERPVGHRCEVEHQLRRRRRLRGDETGALGQLDGTDVMIDAHERRVALANRGGERPRR